MTDQQIYVVGQTQTRFSAELLKRLDAWREKQPIVPTRSEAIRYFVAQGLQKAEG